MSLGITNKTRHTLGIGFAILLGSVALPAVAEGPTLSEEAFEASKQLYFERCAGCHGVLRKGATGKSLEPVVKKKNADGTETISGTLKLGQERLEKIISWGTEGGMNNFSDIMSEQEIKDMATYIQMDPPKPPEMSLAQMKQTRKVYVEEADYPTEPLHGRNWENFFVVIERDVGTVAVIDGDTKEVLAHIPTGYAVHVMKASEHHKLEEPENPGRFWYTMGRDGKMTKIDLWQTPDKMLVSEVKIAYDARDVAVSGDGKYVIGGAYWPPHFAIVDAMTMEPLKVVSTRGVNVDGDYVEEARVAAIYTTPNEPTWIVAVKELGQLWQVDYSDLDNLRIDKIDSAKFLHDGFFDPTGRYFQIAANASNKMVVVDTKERKLEAMIDVAALPHPGPGANWNDPNCGPVAATTHLGAGTVTVWGNDPKGTPDKAWKTCYEVETDGPGLFVRTHPNSDYIWADQTKTPDLEVQQSVQVISKETGEIVKTIQITEEEGNVAVHFEFNKDGTEVWVSKWNRATSKEPNGEMVIYDAKTLEEIGRVKGLYAPTGKFNVYNRSNHVT
ncbi:nitrite reductase (NO-forming) / hydroxylamine reductase [Aliiroseovarius crassostreae]|uniref:Nitrite reductase n=1 Tax=Aliiroseovarius crassostreae TaxID=154981 RepID=A0A0P7ISL6_9RHOB|nr:cytochrome D1 domain-containing protein [Aliiroseovarius crassostreae]KPN61790.1 nitrite reductase [Aliiroseovarius crassostreae]SFU46700.1 nitrite reductase (NO-forming) / hydroxylamine reductase [Aliiroseovarius crassostreae]